MVEDFREVFDYLMKDPDWQVPVEQRAAIIASLPRTLIHS